MEDSLGRRIRNRVKSHVPIPAQTMLFSAKRGQKYTIATSLDTSVKTGAEETVQNALIQGWVAIDHEAN
jgi:hypothetical protein